MPAPQDHRHLAVIDGRQSVSRGQHVIARAAELLDELRTIAIANGKLNPDKHERLHLNLYDDGTGTLNIMPFGKSFGSIFAPISGAVAEFTEWLNTDDVALANATLGLAEDGRYVQHFAEPMGGEGQ